MAIVIPCTAMFLVGVVLLGTLQWLAEKFAHPLQLPMDVLNSVFAGLGFLVCLPFVLGILFEAHVAFSTSLLVGGAILLAAALAFGYSLARLLLPVLRPARARG